ncbi:unnamed protein product [Rotaria magnacalcarata]|uniref:Uncharacterized protein n=2 Tax=Rotaria magnacalcarata TaxID=392030 RepID=A0A819EES8_9BILA|nr:unnamed protein product [Rotaria magnacalcarata]CAF1505816.1 unnamed protein product [Rotaria magnacalcarata]CAF2047982.1 unnamed protein product [Rotaria magnacalcarata]CAF2120614.1 unnamed protein product [Rotaria magnacalcarata]CAF2122554.1 unnamed protein product [Rotaria magnacalcarata]
MEDDEEHTYYGDSAILEPIAEQQDDEITTSPMSSSSMDTSFVEEERRAHEEVRQFEELEKQFASNRRGIRVKFDDEQVTPSIQTTVIKTEPCFHVNSTEDQVTKHFYQNQFQLKDEGNNQGSNKILSRTPSERDSLEEEYIVTFEQKKDTSQKPNEIKNGNYNKIPDLLDQICCTSPGKSILKKSQKKERILTTKFDQTSVPRSTSPPTLNMKKSLSTRSDSNEIQHLAEATAKQTLSQTSPPIRSLFEPTINIFDTSLSNQVVPNTRRPARLQYYVKPYRGSTYIHPDINKNNRSRSLSEQRLGQESRASVWYTFSNQYNQPSNGEWNRRQHVSWSPVREYIHQGRNKVLKSPMKKTELSSNKTSSLLTTNSSSNPCLRSSSSMIPVSVRYRSSRLSEIPQHFRQSFPPSSIDSYESSSITNCSLTPITPTSQNSQYEQKKDNTFISSLPDIIHQHRQEHDNTLQRYDRLLEKMRATDEQLQTLSRSWTNNTQKKTRSTCELNLSLNKSTNSSTLFSSTSLQMCLIILVIFNLLFIYLFNKVNIWWSQSAAHTMTTEQRDEGEFQF